MASEIPATYILFFFFGTNSLIPLLFALFHMTERIPNDRQVLLKPVANLDLAFLNKPRIFICPFKLSSKDYFNTTDEDTIFLSNCFILFGRQLKSARNYHLLFLFLSWTDNWFTFREGKLVRRRHISNYLKIISAKTFCQSEGQHF